MEVNHLIHRFLEETRLLEDEQTLAIIAYRRYCYYFLKQLYDLSMENHIKKKF